MAGKNLFKIVGVLAIALAVLPINGCKKHEHPGKEHPGNSSKKSGLTKEQLADAIEAYIRNQASNGGYFPIADEKTGRQLQMTLVRVHRERLARVSPESYFACVDFKTPEEKLYDVDFFMKGADENNLAFSEFMIHKESGKERYTWYEEDGIWKTKPVEAVQQPAEQPKQDPNEEPNQPPKEEPNKPKEHPREHPEHPH